MVAAESAGFKIGFRLERESDDKDFEELRAEIDRCVGSGVSGGMGERVALEIQLPKFNCEKA